MHKFLSIALTYLTITLFSACSNQDDLGAPHKVYINVLFTPESFCEIGYNDITLKAIETLSHKYGYEYSFCVPESVEDGMKYYQSWCETPVSANIERTLFVFASKLYAEPLAEATHPADSRKDILIFEVEKELPYAYTFDITYYGASYMIGSFYLRQMDRPINFEIIAGNPYLDGLHEVTDGFTHATQEFALGNVSHSYLSDSPIGGLDDDDAAFGTCKVLYFLNQDETNIFIPYAGLSNLGVYRFSQSNHQTAVGIDCIDPDAYSHTYLCMNKKLDLALDDFLQLWVKGVDAPRHSFYTLESGRVTVDRASILDSDSEVFDQLFEQAIAKEKEYFKTQRR